MSILIESCGHIYWSGSNSKLVKTGVKCFEGKWHSGSHKAVCFQENSNGVEIVARLDWPNIEEEQNDEHENDCCPTVIIANKQIVDCQKCKDHGGPHYALYKKVRVWTEYEWFENGNGKFVSRITTPGDIERKLYKQQV